MDRPCHRLKTFFEVDDPNARQGPSFQMTYIREWKRLQFQRLGRCTLLQDTNGIGNVACPFGHDSDVKCQTHIASVQVMLNEHDRHETDKLDLYLSSCFEIHHTDPTNKKGSWHSMLPDELKIMLEEQGQIACTGCHLIVTHLCDARKSNNEDLEELR